MQLRELLDSNQAAIVDRWCDLTLRVYPPESARLMRREKDRFQNPVGRVARESLESIFEGLRTGLPVERMTDALDGIVRIRAVQDLSPSASLAFLFELKRAIRDELGDDAISRVPSAELSALEATIDCMTLRAFELFVLCRDKIHELRIGEIKRRTSVMFKRMGESVIERSDEPDDCGPCDSVNGGCGG